MNSSYLKRFPIRAKSLTRGIEVTVHPHLAAVPVRVREEPPVGGVGQYEREEGGPHYEPHHQLRDVKCFDSHCTDNKLLDRGHGRVQCSE